MPPGDLGKEGKGENQKGSRCIRTLQKKKKALSPPTCNTVNPNPLNDKSSVQTGFAMSLLTGSIEHEGFSTEMTDRISRSRTAPVSLP